MSEPGVEGSADLVVNVSLGPRSYSIRVGSGSGADLGRFFRDSLEASWAGRSCRSALMVTDLNVEPLVGPFMGELEAMGLATGLAVIPPGEASKSLALAERLFQELVGLPADRHTAVVAVGGGVVGDLAGFVASTYARGLPLFMIPTSLLAQVDSSVGGKVGVNLPGVKNIVGAFHQPSGVWIDTDTLATLPERELKCGLAEVVKYGMILDASFFSLLEERAEAALARDPATLRRLIARSCELKAQVVSQDEREETGLRAVLNFGHTIGHAVESVSGYGEGFLHGESVAVGMVLECRLAERLGWIKPQITDRLIALLKRMGLPTAVRGLDESDLLFAMTRDKKNRGGRIRFVLPRDIGRVELTDGVQHRDIELVLKPDGPGHD